MKRYFTLHCKLKQQWDFTIYLLEWPKSRTMTTPNAGEDVEQQELSFIAGGNQNGTATLEDGLMGLFFFFF